MKTIVSVAYATEIEDERQMNIRKHKELISNDIRRNFWQ